MAGLAATAGFGLLAASTYSGKAAVAGSAAGKSAVGVAPDPTVSGARLPTDPGPAATLAPADAGGAATLAPAPRPTRAPTAPPAHVTSGGS